MTDSTITHAERDLNPASGDAAAVQAMIVSYFDIGVSYDLSDAVFRPDELAGDEIGLVGLEPKMGHGIVADLMTEHPEIVRAWREEAARQPSRPDMEDVCRPVDPHDIGADFTTALQRQIETQGITACTLSIFAIGTVLVELAFEPGIPQRFLRGVLRSFEFAAYRPAIARALHAAAVGRVRRALAPGQLMDSPLTRLTIRTPMPESPPDKNVPGYTEQLLMTSFTRVLIARDPRAAAKIDDLLHELDPEIAKGSHKKVSYEYHGVIHCGWSSCALVARVALSTDDELDEDEQRALADDQLKRMLANVEIAHLFLGTCEAFERLFVGEIDEQVAGYLKRRTGGRSPAELNRLRNLALAVAALTDFDLVTQTSEDRAYFDYFAQESRIESKRDFIDKAAGMVYNVADAETQISNSRREIALNAIVLLLTSVTLLSVSSDVYDFVRGDAALIDERIERVRVAVEIVLAILLLGCLALVLVMRPHPLRSRHGRQQVRWEGFVDPTHPRT